jgi:hypothetical protein
VGTSPPNQVCTQKGRKTPNMHCCILIGTIEWFSAVAVLDFYGYRLQRFPVYWIYVVVGLYCVWSEIESEPCVVLVGALCFCSEPCVVSAIGEYLSPT